MSHEVRPRWFANQYFWAIVDNRLEVYYKVGGKGRSSSSVGVTSMVSTFTLSTDQQHVVSQVIYIGQSIGAGQVDIQDACVATLAIYSGNVQLPWSVHFVESHLSDPPTYQQIQAMLLGQPQFLVVAYQWFVATGLSLPV